MYVTHAYRSLHTTLLFIRQHAFTDEAVYYHHCHSNIAWCLIDFNTLTNLSYFSILIQHPQQVYLNMTTPQVITMEFVPGIKVNNIKAIEEAGIDRELLAKRSAESYLTQICRHGFFRK